jgi:hypothetical protein
MKPLLKKLSSILFVALMLLSALPLINAANLPPSTPPPDNIAMWIQPTTVDPIGLGLGLGDTFTVTVWAKANVDIKGWQFWLHYNLNHLNATACVYSAGSTSDYFSGLSTFPVAPAFTNINATHNRIAFGESGGIGVVAPPNTAALAEVTFEILQVPGKGASLISDISISEAANAVTDKTYIVDGTDTSIHYYTAYDALYSYVWAAPPGPILTFDPPSELFEKFTLWNGTTFTENIVLDDLDALWNIVNATVKFTFDITELEITDITLNTADWDVMATADNTTIPGQVDIYVETSQVLGGDIIIASITFRIIDQNLFPVVDTVIKDFIYWELWDHSIEIVPTDVIDGVVTIEGFQSFSNPWMEVVPEDTVVGDGEFVKHTTFSIDVTINRLHYAAQLVGLEFRLGYDDTLLEVVSVEEGPYLGGWAPYGTWFVSYVEPNFYGPHVLVGNLILPDAYGVWNPPFPGADEGVAGENGTIATITFEIIHQLPEPDYLEGTFDLFNIRLVNPDADPIPVELGNVVNGTYTCLGFPWQGRYLDLYGGADNAGYGSIPFPAPYGGQGLGVPMDLVIPQSEVTLFVDLMYNYWPVQNKEVNFEVEGPYDHLFNETSQEWYYAPRENYHILLKMTAISDTDGVATITFAMPWPCEGPDLGVYLVTATSLVRDEVVIDTMYFYYDYLVHIFDVTTDKFYYTHDECVKITIDYGSHAMQTYPALFTAVILDELNVVIGLDMIETCVGGAEFCTYANGSVQLEICIPKWAFVGYADLFVNVYDKDPTEGGFAWGLPFNIDDAIYILPN